MLPTNTRFQVFLYVNLNCSTSSLLSIAELELAGAYTIRNVVALGVAATSSISGSKSFPFEAYKYVAVGTFKR